MNPTLSDLVGGIQTVTLGDQEARHRGTQKTVLERKAPPTFDVVVEIQSWGRLAVHDGVANVVDQWLRGMPIVPEVRWLDDDGQVKRSQEAVRPSEATPAPWSADSLRQRGQVGQEAVDASVPAKDIDVHVFLFGIGRDKMEAAALDAGVAVQVANELRRADVVLTTKTHYRRGSHLVRTAESNGTPVYVLRKNNMPQIQEFLRAVAREWTPDGDSPNRFQGEDSGDGLKQAMDEAEEAAQKVVNGEFSIRLTPQRSYVRRLQHLLGKRYSLSSVSQGREPDRAVLFYKT